MRSKRRHPRLARIADAWLALAVSLVAALSFVHCKTSRPTGETTCPSTSPSAGNECDVDAATICRYGCDAPFVCRDSQWTPFVVNGFQPSVSTCPDVIPDAGSPCDVCRTDLTCSYVCFEQSKVQAVCVGGAWEVDPCIPPSGDLDAGVEDAAGD